MRLFLVRHAIAERDGPAGDAARPLSAAGRAEFAAHALPWLAERGPFDALRHSPWLRAAQTAEMIRAAAPFDAAPEPCAALAAPPDSDALAAAGRGGARVVAVGHQPWLSGLAALACFGDAALGSGIALCKGGVLALEGEPIPGGMRLREAFAPPRR